MVPKSDFENCDFILRYLFIRGHYGVSYRQKICVIAGEITFTKAHDFLFCMPCETPDSHDRSIPTVGKYPRGLKIISPMKKSFFFLCCAKPNTQKMSFERKKYR